MKAPEKCPYCNHSVIKTSNEEIYGKEYGNGRCYLCRNCRAYVGTHSNGRPLGILATKEMRVLKVACHDLFDPIWKSKKISRSKLYGILAEKLGIAKRDCHFGHFETDRLIESIKIMSVPNWWKGGAK